MLLRFTIKRTVIISLLLWTFFTACSTIRTQKGDKEAQTDSTKSLNPGTYKVVELYDLSISDSNPTIQVNPDQKSISGFSSCNSYTCSFERSENTITFQYPMATKVYCPEQADLESSFFKALSEGSKIRQKPESLQLLNDSDEQILFAKVQ